MSFFILKLIFPLNKKFKCYNKIDCLKQEGESVGKLNQRIS